MATTLTNIWKDGQEEDREDNEEELGIRDRPSQDMSRPHMQLVPRNITTLWSCGLSQQTRTLLEGRVPIKIGSCTVDRNPHCSSFQSLVEVFCYSLM